MNFDWSKAVWDEKAAVTTSTVTSLWRISTRQKKALDRVLPFVKLIASTDAAKVDPHTLQATAKAILKEL